MGRVVRWALSGTLKREVRGITPTGKPVRMTGITIYRCVGGKITEIWAEEDWLGAMQQMGATSLP